MKKEKILADYTIAMPKPIFISKINLRIWSLSLLDLNKNNTLHLLTTSQYTV